MNVRVLLADADGVFRRALAERLAATGRIDVVATARDGAEAVELYRALAPDVVLVAVGMPGCDGIEATTRIRAVDGHARIVALTGAEDYRALELCLGAGAGGCFKKGLDAADLAPLSVALAIMRAGQANAWAGAAGC
jgi:DNA-binding NarL/FixJ family response regulator